MRKKVFFFILLTLIIFGWFTYRAYKLPIEKIVETNSDSKIVTIISNAPPSLKINSSTQNEARPRLKDKVITEDSDFSVFDKLEEAWLLKAQEIIGANQFPQYAELRNKNEQEKMQAYKDYHDSLRKQYGDKFSYNITDDQSPAEKKINQKYLKDLLKLIGPEKFKIYTNAKDDFNETMRRKNKEFIQIEF